jgi:WD40 repeat protein
LTTLTWSPDGKTVAAADLSGRLLRWDAPTREALQTGTVAHAMRNYSLAYSPDGKQLAFSHDHLVCVWGMKGPTFRRIAALARDANPRMVWSPQADRLAVMSLTSGSVEIYDVGTGERQQVITRPGANVQGMAWSPDGKRLATTGTGRGQKLLIHEVPTAKLLASSPDGKELLGASSLVWSPDGTQLASKGEFSGSTFKKVLLWDTAKNPLEPRFLSGHDGGIGFVRWSPQGTLLASTSTDNTIRIWKANREVGKLFPQGVVTALSWLSEERLLALVDDGTATLWDVQQAKAERSIKIQHRPGLISPDGRTFAAGFLTATRLVDLDNGRPGATLTLVRPGSPDQFLALSPDGHYVGPAGVEHEIVYVVQTAEGQEPLSPDEFTKKHGWKNDPQRVRMPGE